ncbi:MAG: 6-pyruvoyl-tetrahydropterin synthase-related protein [Syntrophales bacterium]|nr:6-pyruvoyl-tetrahydropterin synthase-related protein [Syntrophales bacterium]
MCVKISLYREGGRRYWVSSSILVALLILSHNMQAYLLAVAIALFFLVWGCSPLISRKNLSLIAESALVGLALTAFWSIPGATQWETPGVPWLPPEIMELKSLSLGQLLSPHSAHAALFLLAFLGAFLWFTRTKDRFAWLGLAISFVFTASLALGPGNPIYQLLPLGDRLIPYRFLDAAALPAAILAGFLVQSISRVVSRGVEMPSLSAWFGFPVAVVFVLFIILTSTYLPIFSPHEYREIQQYINEVPSASSHPFQKGRLATALPLVNGEQAFFPVRDGFNMLHGWNVEGTVHRYTLINHNTAYSENFLNYILRNWHLWNVRSALLDEREEYLRKMSAYLLEQGWERGFESDGFSVLVSNRPSSYLMELNSDVLVIGRSSFHVVRLFPWVTEGRLANPLDYPEEYINLFKVIYLYDFPKLNIAALEKQIEEWTQRGKTVIVDLSWSAQVPELLGVRHFSKSVSGEITLDAAEKGFPYYDSEVKINLKEGSGAIYTGLDEVLLTYTEGPGAFTFAVIGAKQLPGGKAYFIGLHVPRLIVPEHRDEAQQLLETILDFGKPRKNDVPEPFETIQHSWSNHGLTFEYESAEEEAVVISVTHTPRWHVYLNGEPITAYRHENLVLLILPPGRHTVSMRYGSSSAVYTGWLITALAAGWLVWRGKHLAKRQKEEL